MNRELLRYYLGGSFGGNGLSSQCAEVRDLMLAKELDDRARLQSVLEFLNRAGSISDDTVHWLRRGIRGHYGGEGYVLEVTAEEEAAFWLELHLRYPRHAWLSFVAADSRFGWDALEALRLFFDAFRLDSALVHELEGGVCELIGNSEWKLKLELFRLADGVKKKDYYLSETLAQLRSDYRENADALRQIEEVAQGAPVE